MKLWIACFALTGLAVLGAARAADDTGEEPPMPRTFFLGNSLTDHFTADSRKYNPNGPAIERICRQAGLPEWPYGGKNIAGAPLWWHWYHPDQGGRGLAAPWRGQDSPTEALAQMQWDQLTLQPHGYTRLQDSRDQEDRLEDGAVIPAGAPRGDVAMCVGFIGKALENPANRDLQAYVYSTWVKFPDEVRDKLKAGTLEPDEGTYRELWLARNDPPQMYTRQYFETLQDRLNAERSAGGRLEELRKPVLMIPAGDVLLALDEKLRSGELADPDPSTEWTDIRDAFQPGLGIHVNPIGQVIVSYIFYSTLLARSPDDIDMRSLLHEPTETHLSLSDEQLDVIRDTVWEVVRNHPRAGVRERLQARN